MTANKEMVTLTGYKFMKKLSLFLITTAMTLGASAQTNEFSNGADDLVQNAANWSGGLPTTKLGIPAPRHRKLLSVGCLSINKVETSVQQVFAGRISFRPSGQSTVEP